MAATSSMERGGCVLAALTISINIMSTVGQLPPRKAYRKIPSICPRPNKCPSDAFEMFKKMRKGHIRQTPQTPEYTWLTKVLLRTSRSLDCAGAMQCGLTSHVGAKQWGPPCLVPPFAYFLLDLRIAYVPQFFKNIFNFWVHTSSAFYGIFL